MKKSSNITDKTNKLKTQLKISLFVFLAFIVTEGWGQVNIIPIRTDNPFTGWNDIGTAGTTYTYMLAASAYMISPAMDFTAYTSETLNFKARTYGGILTADNTITVWISTNNGSNWNSLGTRCPTTTTLTAMTAFDLSSYDGTQVLLKFTVGGTDAAKGAGLDDITITGIANSPILTATPSSLTGFTYVQGSGPSTSQSYNISGTNLTGAPGNLTITGSTNYEVSSDNTTFGASANIAYASATLNATPVYVRLKTGLTTGTYNSELIANAGGGATTVNVTCSGSVTSSSPTLNTTPATFTGFSYVQGGGPSTSQTYNLSGTNLTGFPGNIAVACATNYEVSTDNTSFAASVNVAYASATLSSTPIYVRLKAGLTAGNYNSESVSNAGGGATTVNVTCSGTVSAPVPTITINSPLTAFGNQCINVSSAEQSYTVTGANLSSSIELPVPSHYELSLTSGSGYVSNPSSIFLPTTGGTVYVRFKPTTTGTKNTNIHHLSGTLDEIQAATGVGTTTPTAATTTAAGCATSTSATSGGNPTADGGSVITAKGVCWNTSTNPTTANSTTNDGTGTGSYVSTISGLTTGTTYYIRSYATNTCGTIYGNEITYTIKNEPTNQPVGLSCGTITANTISLNWTDAASGIVPDGYLIKWSSIGYGSIASPVDGTSEPDGAGVINIAQSIQTGVATGLTPNTTYYFKMWSYSNTGNCINYKLDGTIEQTSCATTNVTACGSEGFNNFNTGTRPGGWTFTTFADADVYTSATNYGALSPSIKFNATGDVVETAAVTFPSELSFWIKNQGATGSFLVEGWNGGWVTVENLTTIPSTTKTYSSGLHDYTKFRFTFTRTAGSVALDDVSITCSCDYPASQATGLSYTSVMATSMTVNWTRGTGNNVMVVAKAGSIVNADPTNGSSYTADASFGAGTQIGTGNYVIYNGTGTSVNLTNLTSNTTYYFAVYEYNNAGICYNLAQLTGSQITPNLPSVTTTLVSSITTNSANSGGNVTSDGGNAVTTRGVCYNTSAAPTTANNIVANGSGTGAYACSLTGLLPQTKYYYRAYATNSIGTAYGTENNFYTRSNEPTAQASGLSATCSSGNSVSLSWTAATFPGSGATAKGYVLLYAVSPSTPSLTSTDGQAPAGTTIITSAIAEATTTFDVTGLSGDITYNFLLVPYCWDGTNNATYNYLTTSAPACSGTTYSSSSTAVNGNSEAVTISSLVDDPSPLSSTTGTEVWRITVRDGGTSLNDADALPTIVSGITITQGGSNTVGNWQNAIQAFDVFDGTTRIGGATITSSQITFTGLNITVNDNTEKTISFRMSLKTTLNVSEDNDGESFQFRLENYNISANTCNSSGFSAFSLFSSTVGKNVIDITATKLIFAQQPCNVGLNMIMLPLVVVKATDVNNNIDKDFSSNISITSDGTLSGTTVTIAASGGIAKFNSLVHTVIGSNITLTAKRTATSDWTISSSLFDVLNATTLTQGGLAVLGLCSNTVDCVVATSNGDDEISFVCFSDITQNTVLEMTDNGWQRNNIGKWGDNEGFVAAKRTGGTILSGSVITFRFGNGGVYSATQPDNGWTFYTIHDFPGTDLVMNSGGDQIYFMQGGTWYQSATPNMATYTGGNILFAFNTNSTWTSEGNSSQHSALYPGLECFSMMPGAATDFLKYNGPATGASQTDWILRLNNSANWTPYANCADYFAAAPDWSVSSSVSISAGNFYSGTWTGTRNTSWFDCGNWQSLSIPSSYVNVQVSSEATSNYPVIGAPPAGFSQAECNNLIINNTYSLTLNNAASKLYIYGNFTNNGSFSMSNSSSLVKFCGNSAQSVNGSSIISIYNLELNNTSSTGLTLNAPVSVKNKLLLRDGIMYSSITDTITLTDGATVHTDASGTNGEPGSATSFVDGPFKKTGNDVFTFPIGDNNVWAPLGIAATTDINNEYIAEIFRTASPNNTPAEMNGLDHVSYLEYWTIDKNAGTEYPALTLYWKPGTTHGITDITDPNNLIVAHWNSVTSKWDDMGRSLGGSSTTSQGDISSTTPFSSFSPVTFGSKTGSNPLPVKIITFDAKYSIKYKKVDIVWSTVSEINNSHFVVEKSPDAKNFTEINIVKGSGNSNKLAAYSVIDYNPYIDINYYRLKQVDFDGKFSYSDIVAVNVGTGASSSDYLFYNKSIPEIKVLTPKQKLHIGLTNLLGQTVYSKWFENIEPGTVIRIEPVTLRGVYFISFIDGNKCETIRFLH